MRKHEYIFVNEKRRRRVLGKWATERLIVRILDLEERLEDERLEGLERAELVDVNW